MLRTLFRRWLRHLLAGPLLAVALAVLACASVSAPTGAVHVLTAKGAVNPVLAGYIDRGIEQAEERGAAAVVVRLDTPGGLDSSMREIVQRIESAQVPVIVYVWPAGARAASAGTFITMVGHVAAMSPNTAIGAAHPVGGGGEEIKGPLGDKVTNDAVAYIQGIANLRGRNAEWAEKAVRESVSVHQDEAMAINVVDLVAANLETLLQQVDGRQVTLPSGSGVLRTANAAVTYNGMNLFERFLAVISDPNITFILLSLGALGILIEMFNPGLIAPGVFGALALIVGYFSVGTLSVDYAFLALLLLAFVLFALELFIASHGVLAIGGIVALGLGGSLFLSGEPGGPSISPWLVWGTAATIGAFFVFIIGAVVRSRRLPAATGVASMVGREAVARSSLDPSGFVFTGGELWSATCEDGRVDEGDYVIVTAVDGLRLRVKKKAAG